MFDITDVTVTLADGYSFDATLNGNNFLVKKGTVPDAELEDSNLTTITVETEIKPTEDEKDKKPEKVTVLTYTNAECCNNFKKENPQRLVFRELSADELRYRALNSKLEFLAVMTDNDISE